jgi:hypothetical protein
MYGMDAHQLVKHLLEGGEIDPKAFSNRLFNLDVNEIKQEIAQAIPGLTVVGVHVLKGMLRNEGESREFYIYLAREPRSDNGFDPQNYPTVQEQKQAHEIIVNWLAAHGCEVLEHRMISTHAMYKNASRCTLTKYNFKTDQGVEISGHDNAEPLKNVRAK